MIKICFTVLATGEVKERAFNSPYLAEQFIRKIERSPKLRLVSIGKMY